MARRWSWWLVGVLGLVVLAGPLGAGELTVKDILRLKKMNFSDADVKAEIERSGTHLTLTEADAEALREAGAGDELLQALKAPVPKALTVQEVGEMVKAGRSVDQVLDALLASRTHLKISAAEALGLLRKEVPVPIVVALKGSPLGANDLKLLAESNLPLDGYLKLAKLVGVERKDLTAADALVLAQAGVPEKVVAMLKQAPEPTPPKPPEPEKKQANLVGRWDGQMTSTAGQGDSVRMSFTADGKYVLTTGLGAMQTGKWSVVEDKLVLVPDGGIRQAHSFELEEGTLKIMGQTGMLVVKKAR